jgi:hypothetical protein
LPNQALLKELQVLYTGVNHFNWRADNFSDGMMGGTGGVTLTADGSNHTKGSDTAVMSALANDVYGFMLCFTAGGTDATVRRQMIDLLIDPAGGTSWSILINNLYTNMPSLSAGMFGHRFYFPVFLPAGTTIGGRTQDAVGGGTVRISMRVFGQPTRPDLLKVGTKVQTLGASTTLTDGVTVVPGTSTMGSYSATLGTLTNDAWWWQLGIGSNDSTHGANLYMWDVAHDATSKYLCMHGVEYGSSTSLETTGKGAYGETPPFRHAPAGTDVYVRARCSGTPDSTFSAAVYAVS